MKRTFPVVELTEVRVSWGAQEVLRGITLRVEHGERWALLGPSGQGKTVLLKVVAGLVRPTSGAVRVFGQDLWALDDDKRQMLRRRVGMLFQKNALFDDRTVAQNVEFALIETATCDLTMAQGVARELLTAVGLWEARDRFPSEISGGMQKRLGVARALALRPELVLYDEPTAGLDPVTSRKIIDLILSLRIRDGGTLMAITNDVNRAYQLASHLGFIFNGEFLLAGDPAATRRHPDPRVQQFIRGQVEGPLTSAMSSRSERGHVTF